ncbi:SUMF1/EgtB/PvdO family nonheme iron enzyme [Candidatus Laterigemmans baculatus]|uniref:SUMF1/EgtB/PvdO family nonheme iron enzyme n=1 Tax=Candidatus Laterigemmans baculatus TaxID=2770505 RepID=UPI0013D99B37|nr:SUMF1/EgtB/PvdO family nonheme iron enzyme [Candidatus Laterigemmans baculatus]
MTMENRLRLPEVEQRVCDVASEQLGISRPKISPNDRLIEDLQCDSLSMVELLMELEDEFAVTLPNDPPNSIYKAVFTRQPFRISDLAELIYLQQGSGTPERKRWRQPKTKPPVTISMPFSQLDGQWEGLAATERRLFEPMEAEGPFDQYRRRSDGMRCILIPSAFVEIGCESPDGLPDEQPQHAVHLDAFLMDAEPVSTTAYCRFLNSIGEVPPEVVADWFVVDPQDHRIEHLLIARKATEWRPVLRTEKWPMILVSWFGANAYSLWANGQDWKDYRDSSGDEFHCFLPTEAQWEYAARGVRSQPFPWGDEPPTQQHMRYGLHRKSETYNADTLPMADVNEQLGMSPFGLQHMAGNVWQWCRDWYDKGFYSKPEANRANPLNRLATQVRSERGGSWIGPAELCRSSYRRGRPPSARGRCLGFRCISSAADCS